MPKREKIKKDPDGIQTNDAPEIVDDLEFTCDEIVNDYIMGLNNPEDIYINNGLFVDMLKHLYKQYLGNIIGNINNTYIHYDYKLLNRIFSIYTSLVYKYKQNKRPSIIEFSLFVNMDRNTIYHAANGMTKNLTPSEVCMVKNWYTECENQLTNGGSVFEIFLLKSQYRYNDNLAPIPIENQGAILSADQLPDFKQLKIAKKSEKDLEKT